MTSLFQPLKTLSRSQSVFNTIKDAIFSGKLQPGTTITELQLANDFDVSQSTIREALLQLERIGLVIKIPHKGTMVTELSDDEIKQRLIVRYHLEELACTQAAQNMQEQHFKELYEIIKGFTEAMQHQSFFTLNKTDLLFHRYIWKQSQNEVLYRSLDQISVPLFAFVAVQRSLESQNLSKVIVPHENIIHALETRDNKIIIETIRQDAQKSYNKYFSR